mgnify:CR=1 FL=1
MGNFFINLIWEGAAMDELTLIKNTSDILKEILKEMLSSKTQASFRISQNTILASYVPKQNKAVVMLSTLHENSEINEHDHNRP